MKIGNPKPHEFISFLILTNSYFTDYWAKNVVPLFPRKEDAPDPADMAHMIIQIPPSQEKRYLQEIISGPFDVDKLEYLYRDSRTTGLEITYDIERYFYKIQLIKQRVDGTWRLVMDKGGVRAVEQIIFSKMMLFSFVYHHHKVLASDNLISDLIMEVLENGETTPISIKHPLDFLKYTDSDILAFIPEKANDRFSAIREKIFKRDLPKRCFVLNKEFVLNLKTDFQVKRSWDELKHLLRDLPDKVLEFRKEIVELIKKEPGFEDMTPDDLYVVFPKVPSMEESEVAPVLGTDSELHPMSDFFDIAGWRTTYGLKKLRGYFYTYPKYMEVASRVIEQYLDDRFKLKFSENARTEAKLSPDSD